MIDGTPSTYAARVTLSYSFRIYLRGYLSHRKEFMNSACSVVDWVDVGISIYKDYIDATFTNEVDRYCAYRDLLYGLYIVLHRPYNPSRFSDTESFKHWLICDFCRDLYRFSRLTMDRMSRHDCVTNIRRDLYNYVSVVDRDYENKFVSFMGKPSLESPIYDHVIMKYTRMVREHTDSLCAKIEEGRDSTIQTPLT